MITLTDKALEATRTMLEEAPRLRGLCLRLYLDGKGCDGFYYGVTFDQREADDHLVEIAEGVNLVVDSKTLVFVEGASIDWVDDERGRGFLVHNPQHRKFRGKFYRRQGWQERLGGGRAGEGQSQDSPADTSGRI